MINIAKAKVKKVQEYPNYNIFKKECLQGEEEVCIVALLDGRKNNYASIKSNEMYMEALFQLNANGMFNTDQYPQAKIHWVNATCHVIIIHNNIIYRKDLLIT